MLEGQCVMLNASIAPKRVDYLKEVRILSIEYSVHTCSLPRSQLRSVKIEDKIVNNSSDKCYRVRFRC